jgi:hypothetical protein
MAHYLLPCECGRKLDVTTADAGEQLSCACGRKVDVPTLRGLEELEQAQPRPSATPSARLWGARQGLAFLGASLVVIAMVCLVLSQLWRPLTGEEMLMEAKKPDLVDVDTVTPAVAWLRWDIVRQGLLRPLTVPEAEAVKSGRNSIENWHLWRIIACVGAGLGLVLVLASFLIPQRGLARRAPRLANSARR